MSATKEELLFRKTQLSIWILAISDGTFLRILKKPMLLFTLCVFAWFFFFFSKVNTYDSEQQLNNFKWHLVSSKIGSIAGVIGMQGSESFVSFQKEKYILVYFID